jgi:chaperonin GroES
MSFNYIPTYDKIIVKPDEVVDRKTANGLIIPQTVNDNTHKTGTVVAAGPGYIDQGKNIKPQSSTGNKVLYNPLAALPLKIDGTIYHMLPDKEILAIISDTSTEGYINV